MFKKILFVFSIIFIAIQFFPVQRTNPAVTQEVVLDDATRKIFKRACFDCHSNETVWPWYGYVAPVSWLVANDVNHGRSHINFSEWGRYTLDEKKHILKGIPEEIEIGAMPLWFYKPLHPEAKISAEDFEAINAWATERMKELQKDKETISDAQ